MKMFDAPIPGESLTQPPGKFPWERPPEIVDPEEALQMHLTRLTEPEVAKAMVDMLEMDIDVKTLVSGLMRSAAAEGIHTIDVGMIIAPAVHKYIVDMADDLGIDYDEGLVDKKQEAKEQEAIVRAKALHRVKKLRDGKEAAPNVQMKAEPRMNAPTEEPNVPTGLMKRRGE